MLKRVLVILIGLFIFYVLATWFINDALGIDKDPLDILKEVFQAFRDVIHGLTG